MPNITIGGTVIDFPDSAESPNWAPSIIQFAQAVASTLSTVVNTYDIASQVYTMVANVNSGVSLPNLSFSTSAVRAAFIRYSVFRSTTTANGSEAGTLVIVYNPNNAPGLKWEKIQVSAADASVSFTITDAGQVQFSSTALAGASHTGFISYVAQALTQI